MTCEMLFGSDVGSDGIEVWSYGYENGMSVYLEPVDGYMKTAEIDLHFDLEKGVEFRTCSQAMTYAVEKLIKQHGAEFMTLYTKELGNLEVEAA